MWGNKIPRKPQVTTASGSLPANFLTQSPRGAFTIGSVEKMGDVIWGYSGEIAFDVTAAASYPLLRFTLDKNAMIKVHFNADWDQAVNHNAALGINIAIDGIAIIDARWEGSTDNAAFGGMWVNEFFLPAGRDCNMISLNPSGSAENFRTNVNIVGQYI
jgi:hypothetical protein